MSVFGTSVGPVSGGGRMPNRDHSQPSHLTVNADYAAAAAKLTQLMEQREKLGEEVERCSSELLSLGTPRSLAQETITAKALALIGISADSGVGNEAKSFAARQRMAKLREDLAVTARALEIQERRVDEIACRAAMEMGEMYAPEHRQKVRAIAQALANLVAANAAEIAFRDMVQAKLLFAPEVIRPMPFQTRRMGKLHDPGDTLGRYLEECVDWLFLTKGEAKTLLAGGEIKP